MLIKALYQTLWGMLFVLTLMTAWLVGSTGMVISPSGIHYSGRDVTFVRATPFGDVLAEWSTEIRVSATGRECHSGTHLAEYQQEPDDTVIYELGDWANKCLEEGPPLVVVNTIQAKLFGLIPLRPIRIVSIIEVDTAKLSPLRS